MQRTRPISRLALAALIFLSLSAAFTAGVWRFAFQSAIGQVVERGQSDLRLASDRLINQLELYREMAVIAADRFEMRDALQGRKLGSAQSVLLRTADKTSMLEARLVAADGQVVVSSERQINPVDLDRRDTPTFQRAMQGALGTHHARIDGVAARAFTFSAPVFQNGTVVGVIEVDVNVRLLEAEWLADPEAVFFTDEAGIVFISNRNELLFRRRGLEAETGDLRFGYSSGMIRPFVDTQERRVAGYQIWDVDGGPYLPDQAVILSRPLPTVQLTAELLLDIRPAQQLANLQAAFAAALALIFGGALFVLWDRRRILTDRLQIEAAANAELERRVAARTAELKKAQGELVQASKLSALGQMSAGISHELNQPLMAIQNFAENGKTFLKRGGTDKAADNLNRIAEMSARMARIIKNLRAFARNESEPMGKVDLVAVIEHAVEITGPRLARDQIALDWVPPDVPVHAYGGEVRLGQVFVNLITNAADAMIGQTDPRVIRIVINNGRKLAVTVRDTGPGIDEPDKIFDPFYTTKQVSEDEGMGLGLSISYGLVQSFGGNIRGTNAPDGRGAFLTVELEYWNEGTGA